MLEFIKNMSKDWIGRFVLIMCTVVMALTVLILVVTIQNQMNYISEGKVISMKYNPSGFTPISNGKTTMLIYHNEKYNITISDGNKQYNTSINKKDYNNLNIGDWYKLKK